MKKLVSDLETVKSAWEKNIDGNKGLYQAALKGELTGENASKTSNQMKH